MKIMLALVGFTLIITTTMAHRIHPLSDEFIAIINSKQTLWTAGRNFHRNTSLKYLKMLSGTIRDEGIDEDPYIGKPPRYKYSTLPLNFDARDKWNFCPSLNDIRDQGACGSCWAVSTVAAMTDRLCIQSKGRENFHFSELDVMSCCMFCGSPCNGGILRTAWQYGQKKGIVSGGEYNSHEGCKPYTIPPCEHNPSNRGSNPPCGHKLPETICRNKCQMGFNKPYVKDRKRIARYYQQTNELIIMEEIFERGPVTVSFWVYEDFLNYKTGIYRFIKGKKMGLHSVKLIGWGEENGVQYWLAANSWNADWGDRGFFKILRGKNHLDIEKEAYAGTFRFKD